MSSFGGNSSLIDGGFDPRRVDNNPQYILRTVLLYLGLTTASFFLYTALRNTFKPYIATRLGKTNRVSDPSSGSKRRWRIGSKSFNERSALLQAEMDAPNASMGPGGSRVQESMSRRCGRYFKWVKDALKMEEAELIRVCGMDAYLTLRLIRFAFRVLMTFNVVGVFVLIPVYKMQPASQECRDFCAEHKSERVDEDFDAFRAQCICNTVDQMSLANLRADNGGGSNAFGLWVPVGAMVYFAVATLLLLWREYKHIIRIRLAYYQTRPPQLYTVLVQGIPRRLQSPSGHLLQEHFERIFPGTVHSVYCFQHPSDMLTMLQQIGQERFSLLNQLEYAVLVQQTAVDKGRVCRLDCTCCKPVRNQEIARLYAELTMLNQRFSRLRKLYMRSLDHFDNGVRAEKGIIQSIATALPHASSVLGVSDPAFPVAFVTFRSLVSAMIAVQSQLYDSHKLTVRTAPEPRDLVWENLGINHKALVTRNLLSKALFALIVLFWGVISSFIGVATSTAALSRAFPWINELLKVSVAFSNVCEYT